ncbi:MAG: hypothetical protein RX318_03390 [bacterium]|nr:hypothetical protein [bacterium]
MIWESIYWKEDLIRQAKALKKRISQRRWTERSLANLEKTIMLGFYSIRKLIEAKQLTQEIVRSQIPLIAYPWKGKQVTLINWHKVDELYDFERETHVLISLLPVCNKMVHSYVFMPCYNEKSQIHSVLVNSDHSRHEALYLITVSEIIRLFERVGKDYVRMSKMKFDANKGDYEILQAK